MNSGLLLLDKAKGCSSNRALQQVKRLLGVKKAGHTGSLDPLATGLLPLCIGEATKYAQFLLDADKIYEVELQLGVRTTTSDAEGEVIAEKPVPEISSEQLEAALQTFRGEIEQSPSMYSALKYEGKPLYYYARKGIEVPRKTRCITVHEFSFLERKQNHMRLRVHCSKGTYVRTLVDDLGELLGCGAHVTELRRLQVGRHFRADMMHSFDEIEAAEDPWVWVMPISVMLQDYPEVILTDEQAQSLLYGQKIAAPAGAQQGLLRLMRTDGSCIGLGTNDENNVIAPRRLTR